MYSTNWNNSRKKNESAAAKDTSLLKRNREEDGIGCYRIKASLDIEKYCFVVVVVVLRKSIFIRPFKKNAT